MPALVGATLRIPYLRRHSLLSLGTRFGDDNGRFCMSSAAAGANRACGLDRGLPFPLTDLAGADAVLLLGSNPAETMPPFVRHLAPVRGRGGLLVVDPRRSATAALTDDGAVARVRHAVGPDLIHAVVKSGYRLAI